MPSAVAGPELLRQRLALSIGARQAAQVRSISGADAGDEKRHVCLLLLQAGAGAQRQQRYYHDQGKTRGVLHSSPPVPSLRSRWAVGRIRERRFIERTYRTRDIERFADRVQGATRCQKKSSASHFFVNSVLPLD